MTCQLLGNFDLGSLHVKATGHKYVPPESLTAKTCAIWEEAVKKYQGRLWNGVNYRYEGFDQATATLLLGEAEYKYNYASNFLIEDLARLDFSGRPNCLYVTSVVVTRDQKVVLGQTAVASIHGVTLNLLGGVLNRDEMVITSGEDLAQYLYKELNEEIGITRDMISSSTGLGIFERPNYRIGIFLQTHLRLTARDLQDRMVIEPEELAAVEMKTKAEILASRSDGNVRYTSNVNLALSFACLD